MSIKAYIAEEEIKKLEKDIDSLSAETIAKIKQAVTSVAMQAHEKIVHGAEELGTKRSKYLDALHIQKLTDTQNDISYSITLDKSAKWIEDGMPAGNRVDMILNGGKPAKQTKSGEKYKIIPFEHNKSPNQTSKSQKPMVDYVKSELNRLKLDKIARGPDKKAILNKNNPEKWQKIAAVKVGEPNKFLSKLGKPLLQGLTVYQRQNGTILGEPKVERSAKTFRFIGERHRGSTTQWYWKEQKGANLFEKTEKELDQIFQAEIKKAVE